MRTRGGFTLVELIVAMVLFAMVGAVTYKVLINTQRMTRTQAEHVSLQDNVRAGILILPTELKELGYDTMIATNQYQSDLYTLEPSSIRYRAMRGLGFTCSVQPNEIIVRGSNVFGLRLPVAGRDSLVIYRETDPNTAADDEWLRDEITGVTLNVNCPDGTPGGIRLNTSLASAAGFVVGGPIRSFEVMRLRYYQSNGRWWLGAQSESAGEAIQPVLGPLADSSAADQGLRFTYLDRNGAVTADARRVRTIQLSIKGVTDGAVRNNSSGHLGLDSLRVTTRITLRNSQRPW